MSKVGFIGLGNMGRGMCRNLIGGGHDLYVFDMSADALKAFEQTAHVCKDPVDVLNQSEVVFLSLPSSKVVDAIVEDFLQAGVAGKIIVDTSTSSPLNTKVLHGRVKQAGGGYVDAPLNAAPRNAEAGDVIACVGGDEKDVKKVHDLLMCFCSSYNHFGGPGSGNLIKIALNYSGLVQVLAYAQLFPIMEHYGINREDLYQSFNNESYSNVVFQFYSDKYINQDYRMDFEMPLALKDLLYMKSLCDNMNIPGFLLDGAIDLLRVSLKEGQEKKLDVSYACETIYEFVNKQNK